MPNGPGRHSAAGRKPGWAAVLLACGLAAGRINGAETTSTPEMPRNMEARRHALEDRILTRFALADADRSGHLTKEEFDRAFSDLKGRFDDIDQNRDRFITEKELRDWRGRKFEERRAGIEVRREGAPAPASLPAKP